MTDKVAIDNDFLSHLVDIQQVSDLFTLITRFFNAIGVSPEMHPLVFTNEAKPNQKEISIKLFSENVIGILDFDSICCDPSKKKYYEMQIRQVYHDFTGEIYPCNNVCEQWKTRKSLGEVHTVVLCVFLGCDCFLSDDKDASKKLGRIINKLMSKPIEVKNRQDCCDYIKNCRKDLHDLKSNELSKLGHRRTS